MLPDKIENTKGLSLEEMFSLIDRLDQKFNAGEDKTEYLAICLAGEVGELLNNIKRMISTHDGAKRRDKKDFKDKFVNESGDVLLYFVSLMKHLGVTPWEAFEAAWAKVQERLKGTYYRYEK